MPASRPIHCGFCDYDLTGSLAAHRACCPECGRPLLADARASAREARLFRRLGWGIPAVLLASVMVMVLALLAMPQHALFIVPLGLLVLAAVTPVTLAVYSERRLREGDAAVDEDVDDPMPG